MLAGPLFVREWMSVPRRPRSYIMRSAYAGLFFVLLWTTWQALIGFDRQPGLGEVARFNVVAFQLFSFTQLALVLFAGSLYGAGSISIEKDRRTFILLLVTRMSDSEIVLGKFAAAVLQVGFVLAASVPVFFLLTLFGGVGFVQVGEVFAATVGGALYSIALGTLIAVWRDKTFQAIALTIVGVTLSLMIVEIVVAVAGDRILWGLPVTFWCACLSPARAIAEALTFDPTKDLLLAGVCQLGVGIAAMLGFLAVSIWGLRRWNPRGEPIERREADEKTGATKQPRRIRDVWENPVLWREMKTRAYGTRPIVIKLGYLAIAGLLLAGLLLNPPETDAPDIAFTLARTFLPVCILSLLLINAQALAAVTSERDLKSIDLLLVTDVTPPEFVFGKLVGVAYNTKEMILAPLVMIAVAAALGMTGASGLIFTSIAFLVMAVFAAVLGVHAGLRHVTSRTALVNSLGTMFFLLVGILICLYLIVISGRFEAQWASFVLFIVLGSIGLWISLSANAPSGAITLTASTMPVATFYCILAFVVGDRFAPFAVASVVYGFAVVAMLVPLLSEFDVATGRTSHEGD